MNLCRYCGHNHYGASCNQAYDIDGEIRALRRMAGRETKMPCGHWTDEHGTGACPGEAFQQAARDLAATDQEEA